MARGFAPSRSLKYRSRDRGHSPRSRLSASCRQLHVIAQAQILAPELLEETIDRVELLFAGFKLIHVVPETRGTGEPLRIPGDVFSRDLDSRFRAIESVELMQVREQHGMDLGNERMGQFLAR